MRISLQTLAKHYGSDTKGIRRLLAQLKESGYLTVLEAGDSVKRFCAIYRLVAVSEKPLQTPASDAHPRGEVPPGGRGEVPPGLGAREDGTGGEVPPLQKEEQKKDIAAGAAADAVGVSHTQVRTDLTAGGKLFPPEQEVERLLSAPPEKVTGRDGKQYAATKPEPASKPEPTLPREQVARRDQPPPAPAPATPLPPFALLFCPGLALVGLLLGGFRRAAGRAIGGGESAGGGG